MNEQEIEREIERRAIPPRYRELYKRALAGGSRKAAIQAMCLECQGWEDGAIIAVRTCASTGCPLHAVRPYQEKEREPEHDSPGEDDGDRNE